MSCMLRIFGLDIDIDALLAKVFLVPEGSHRRGEPRFKTKPDGRKSEHSGAGFMVSDAEFDEFETQKADALAFLKVNKSVIQEIMAWEGLEGGFLDFGIWRRDVVVQCDCFPAELLKAAGDLGLDIELSQYPNGNGEEPTPS